MSKSSKGKKRARTVESSRAGSGTEGEVIGEDANEDEDDADDEDDDIVELDPAAASQLSFIRKKVIPPLTKNIRSRATTASAIWARDNKQVVDDAVEEGSSIGQRNHTIKTLWDVQSPNTKEIYIREAQERKSLAAQGDAWIECVVFAYIAFIF